MWFSTLVVKNLIRRPLRSILTILAISLAIASVVSLVGIADGFEASFRKLYDRKGIDIFVVRSGPTQRISSSLPESLGDKIRQVPGVKDIIPGLFDIVVFPNSNLNVPLNGWVPESYVFEYLKVLEGRKLTRYDEKKVMLGTVLARNLQVKVGDHLVIQEGGEPFEVVGIHETFNVLENGALVMPLRELQEIMDRKGQVTGFSVILDPEMKKANPDLVPTVRHQIEKLEKSISALSTQDHLRSLTEIQLVKAMAWLTSAIALAIGLFGVMNTMVMAVNERTKEIGVLRAVGWRPKRVLRLVLLEAVVMSLVGAIVGILFSILLVQTLTRLPRVSGFIDGNIQPIYFFYGFAIAVLVGLLGGIFPARRASRMLPTAALRQE